MKTLDATRETMKAKQDAVIDKLGIQKFSPQMEMATMGGVQYQKVPGGWKKVQ